MRLVASLLFYLPVVHSVLQCTSFFGLETSLFNTDCSWQHPATYYMDELGQRGFNTIRVPFSATYIQRGDFTVMDDIFDKSGEYNISVILDWHRNFNTDFQQDWLEGISNETYLKLYKQLIDRYIDRPQLTTIGLFNEYKGTNVAMWKENMDCVVRKMEQMYPNRFIWLIGCPEWSGNCHDMDWSYLPFFDRIRYDIHKYVFSVGVNQTSFEHDWQYSFPKHRNHTIVGEWGYFSDKPEQVAWAERFVKWLRKEGIRNSCFWVSVSDSADTGGLWKNCETFEKGKYLLLQSLWGRTNLRFH